MNRRNFLKTAGAGLSTLFIPQCIKQNVPSYLEDYEEIYMQDPHKASIEWFENAKFGLFINYGLYSLLGRGAWVQFYEKIPVAEYAKLKDQFTAEKFDPDFITNLAIEAEMKYINFDTMHHDGFCLFRTKQTQFNSVESPARRDFVEELATACLKKGLGLCLYYSHGRNWSHSHAPNNDLWGGKARPEYDPPEPAYRYGEDHDLNIYIDYVNAQMTELLTQYGPIANIWFDGWKTPISGPTEKFRLSETYALIRKLQPQCLISYKWGITGTEDFFAPEYNWPKKFPDKTREMIQSGKPIEICYHIAGWAYRQKNDGKHRGVDSIIENLEYAAQYDANLLLATAPLPDGSIDTQDVRTLREVGKYIRENGWPE